MGSCGQRAAARVRPRSARAELRLGEEERDLARGVLGAVRAVHEFCSMLSARSARIVPGVAFLGLVAPMISRFLATAPSPSSTCTTPGPRSCTRRGRRRTAARDGRRRTPRPAPASAAACGPRRCAGPPSRSDDDVTDEVLADGVRLDDGKRALDGHTDPWNDCPAGQPAGCQEPAPKT